MVRGIIRPSRYSPAAAKCSSSAALSEPLISKQSRFTDSLSSEDDTKNEDEELSLYSDSEPIMPDSMSRTGIATTAAVSLLVAGGLAASTTAMIAIPSAIVIATGVVCVVDSSAVAHKHLRIMKSAGMRSAVNGIEEEIGFLRTEIAFVSEVINDLQSEAHLMAEFEEDLREIAAQQGTGAKYIVDSVNENEMILKEMKTLLREMFVASMAKIIIRSDTDGDMKINLDELPMLALRLKIELETYGMNLDVNKFIAMIKEDNDIPSALRLFGEVLFEVQSNESDAGNNDINGLPFFKLLDDQRERKMMHEEMVSMVDVHEKYTRGSVDVARGKRSSLLSISYEKYRRKKSIVNSVKRKHSNLSEPDHTEPTIKTLTPTLISWGEAKQESMRSVLTEPDHTEPAMTTPRPISSTKEESTRSLISTTSLDATDAEFHNSTVDLRYSELPDMMLHAAACAAASLDDSKDYS